MSFESNFSNICRTCLSENITMKSAFLINQIQEEEISLSAMLMSFTSVQILKGDGLPHQLCEQCAEEVNRLFLFRKMCESSDNTLKRYAQPLLPLTTNNFYIKDEKNEIIVDASENFIDDGGGSDEIWKEEDENQYQDPKPVGNIHDGNKTTSNINNVKSSENISKKKISSCILCGASCLGLAEYRRHMTKFHKEIFQCRVCNEVYASEVALKRHFESHNVSSNDENCSTIYKSTFLRENPGTIQKRNLPHTCDICNKVFSSHCNLERHKLIHSGEKPYLCNVCGKGFAQLSYLKIHSFIHTGEKPYKCKVCGKSFTAPGTLLMHLRTHTGEGSHVCKICGKDFRQSRYLSAHIRRHTGEKPVECKVCNRRFNQNGKLVIHMRIHSGEKPYHCSQCGRSFAIKGTLKKHIRTHTGERPYVCRICGQAFAQSGTLATHKKIHTRNTD
ncbi:hypothetical protein RI129_007151 [Pyrocoelia pectoralis]|uniref:Uncharacterized protein n=1 Tax=Pyrocoelia pectoralis TaxID=417401 RepID=A0AAN7VDW8_9COLE